ncbi:MAG: chlorophyll synthase ChlG [Proteobacteria bacterium]|nr:chlorophyll synthase ChlG [Pseudomonadota bacterium]MDA0914902.1 chlorophyll synthase ChlG [Pseudomonadota bacterium]MDA1032179.1 chlorophyll synthase ChlG [Pseudomonadota bacterium]
MARSAVSIPSASPPAARDVLELLKPITWFPPMWAFMCGVVSSGVGLEGRWWFLAAGIALTGPLVCGTSQAVNDWFDRHVDAINEPNRPIPSGRVGSDWGLRIAIIGTFLSLVVAWFTGPFVLAATVVGLICAWCYSAPPFRLKTSGWLGPAVVALTYEGLAWFTGASVMAGALPKAEVLIVLALYSLGAHGIMTLNDFKAVEGDRATGLRSLPVTLGVKNAAQLACATMTLPQFAVIALLYTWGHLWSAIAVSAVLLGQLALMPRLLSNPKAHVPWYSATGVTLYVLGMLGSALGLGAYI